MKLEIRFAVDFGVSGKHGVAGESRLTLTTLQIHLQGTNFQTMSQVVYLQLWLYHTNNMNYIRWGIKDEYTKGVISQDVCTVQGLNGIIDHP